MPGDLEKAHFVKLMRAYETFCGAQLSSQLDWRCLHLHVLGQATHKAYLTSDATTITS
jgi:hypothetical protein